MSMPAFPEDGIDITRDQAFNMLLGSIAMEELGLSHIINAEGEKLQYVLGTLPHATAVPKATTKDLLEVNQSITTLLEHVAHNQFLLKGKLTQVLEAQEKWCPPPCPQPCPPPNLPPCHGGQLIRTRVFRECREGPWRVGQCFAWKSASHCKENGSSNECSSAVLCCAGSGVPFVSFSFELLLAEPGQVTIALSYPGICTSAPVLKSSGYAAKANEPIHLSGSSVLTPPLGGATASSLVFSLCEPQQVTVKRATLTLTTVATSPR